MAVERRLLVVEYWDEAEDWDLAPLRPTRSRVDPPGWGWEADPAMAGDWSAEDALPGWKPDAGPLDDARAVALRAYQAGPPANLVPGPPRVPQRRRRAPALSLTLVDRPRVPTEGVAEPIAAWGGPNRWSQACLACGELVRAGEGLFRSTGAQGWEAAHPGCLAAVR